MKVQKIIKCMIVIFLFISIFNIKTVFAQIDIDSTVINDKNNNNNKVKADDNKIFTKENDSKENEYKMHQKKQKNENIDKIFSSKPKKDNIVVKQLFQKKENFDVFKSKNNQNYQYLIYIITAIVTVIVIVITHKYYQKKRRKNENFSNNEN